MAAITQSDTLGLDLVYRGQSYVDLAPASIDTSTLDYVYRGQTFVTPSTTGSPPVTFNTAQFFMLF